MVIVVAVVSYVASPPSQRMDVGFASPDFVVGLQRDSAHQFRADVQVDVDMRTRLRHPLKALRNLACKQPVKVVAVVSGTAPLWRELSTLRRAGYPGETRIGLGVSAPVDDLTVRLAEGELGPLRPSSEARTMAPSGGARLKVDPTSESGKGLSGWDGRRSNEQLHRATMHDWAKHRGQLVVTFTAPWASFRSFGSCYVQLPRLVRSDAAESAAEFASPGDALGDSSGSQGPSYAGVTDGFTRLNTDGVVQRDQSEPSPTASGAVEGLFELNDAVWTCSRSDFDLGFDSGSVLRTPGKSPLTLKGRRSDSSGKSFVAPFRAFRTLAETRSCQAVAVVTAPEAALLPVFLLLVVGAVAAPLFVMFWKAALELLGLRKDDEN